MPLTSNSVTMIPGYIRDHRVSYFGASSKRAVDRLDRPHEKTEQTHASIRFILIDADPVTVSTVRTRLLRHHDFEMLAEASSGEDALTKIEVLQPDAIFVDIEMMESSGIELPQLFCQPVRPIVVFLTADRDYALEAFDLGAADCLLKPISDDRFEISLSRIRRQFAQRAPVGINAEPETARLDDTSHHRRSTSARIIVTDRRRTHVIEASEIEWIGAAGDYTELHVRGATHLLREPLFVLLSRLPANLFCRIHRSFVVNLSRVSGFKTLRNQDLLVRLKDRTILRASRTFSDELRKAITQQCSW